MNFNWNVYKVFKNGKRAILPFHTFNCSENKNAEEHFADNILISLPEKIQKAKYLIIRADLSQERKADVLFQEQRKTEIKRMKVLKTQFNKLDFKPTLSNSTVAALVLCKESNWQWQWSFVENGTSRFICGLSPTFSSYDKAHEWMKIRTNTA